MSRLSARNKEFMNSHSRYTLTRTAIQFNTKHKSTSSTINSSKHLPPNNQLHLKDFNNYYNIKEGKFEIPFTGPISIPRGTFQLYSSNEINIIGSSSTPANLQKSESHKQLMEDMKKMIPLTVKSKRNMKLCLRTSIRQLTSLKLSPYDMAFVSNYIPQVPYGRANSRQFFQYCKDGNLLQVEILLAKDKYLSHVFDPMKMTALH